MKESSMRVYLVLLLGCAAAHAAPPFAPVGARAVLTVDYLYESAGRKSENGGYDPYEWKVKRNLSMEAQLAAQAPLAMPTVQPMDAAQVASLEGKAKKAQEIAAPMAPMMADAQKIMARCGDDEACITREVQKMGAAMAGTQQMADARKAGSDMAALGAPGAARYQAFRATSQAGTYLIDEEVRISNADPICLSRPRGRCTRSETRKGGGNVPAAAGGGRQGAAGISAVEWDSAKGTLALVPPIPLGMLAYTETIASDEPDGTYDTPIARGARPKQAFFRVSGTGNGFRHDKPLVVPVKGGWRNQQGEQVVKLQGKYGDAGTLTVRWRFVVQ
jgi:hypothetical protein